MILCAAGDTHGALDRLYQEVADFEKALRVRFEALLHVGDFGIWPDPERVDRATRNHEGAGDFPRWVAEARPVPLSTWFVKGNHEDFEWLESRVGRDILPGLQYLPNGRAIDLDDGGRPIRIAGIGGCFGPSDYRRSSAALKGYERRHYTQDEIDRAKRLCGVDVLLLHDAPRGVEIPKSRGRLVSNAEGLDEAVVSIRPRVCFFGHHHARVRAEIGAIPLIGLNIVGKPGHLVAIDIEPRGREWTLLGEWPDKGTS